MQESAQQSTKRSLRHQREVNLPEYFSEELSMITPLNKRETRRITRANSVNPNTSTLDARNTRASGRLRKNVDVSDTESINMLASTPVKSTRKKADNTLTSARSKKQQIDDELVQEKENFPELETPKAKFSLLQLFTPSKDRIEDTNIELELASELEHSPEVLEVIEEINESQTFNQNDDASDESRFFKAIRPALVFSSSFLLVTLWSLFGIIKFSTIKVCATLFLLSKKLISSWSGRLLLGLLFAFSIYQYSKDRNDSAIGGHYEKEAIYELLKKISSLESRLRSFEESASLVGRTEDAALSESIKKDALSSFESELQKLRSRVQSESVDSEATQEKFIEKLIDDKLKSKIMRESEKLKLQVYDSLKDVVLDEINSADSFKQKLENLISNSLTSRGLDALKIPDYALGSAGAVIIPGLTSESLSADFKSPVGRVIGKIFSLRKTVGKSAKTILEPSVQIGECWAMKGSSGHVGIQLARPIIPESFTIDHVPSDFIFDKSKGYHSAPKRVSLLAIFNRKISEPLESLKYDLLSSWEQATLENHPDILILKENAIFNPLDISSQTFSLEEKAIDKLKTLSLAVQDVVLLVHDNWGSTEWTCIYRVRVHGNLT